MVLERGVRLGGPQVQEKDGSRVRHGAGHRRQMRWGVRRAHRTHRELERDSEKHRHPPVHSELPQLLSLGEKKGKLIQEEQEATKSPRQWMPV